ncbi:hypothetical protein Tco_1524758, partial [Tanacetum coccineum]
MKRVNTFAYMNSEVVKGGETRTEESSKRAGDELESDKSKKQKINEHVKAEKDDDPKEEEMKKHMAIIVKEGQKGFYHLIRADEGSKRYSSMIRMLQGIDREDLETLWKLVKEKHGINRPVDEYERVLWGDMKVDTVDHDGKWIETEEEDNPEEIQTISFCPRQEPIELLEWKALENQLKPSMVEPQKLELKGLPEHLEYAFIQEDKQLLAVISSALSTHKRLSFSRSLKTTRELLLGALRILKEST